MGWLSLGVVILVAAVRRKEEGVKGGRKGEKSPLCPAQTHIHTLTHTDTLTNYSKRGMRFLNPHHTALAIHLL